MEPLASSWGSTLRTKVITQQPAQQQQLMKAALDKVTCPASPPTLFLQNWSLIKTQNILFPLLFYKLLKQRDKQQDTISPHNNVTVSKYRHTKTAQTTVLPIHRKVNTKSGGWPEVPVAVEAVPRLFKCIDISKMTPPSLQLCLIRKIPRYRKGLHSCLYVIGQMSTLPTKTSCSFCLLWLQSNSNNRECVYKKYHTYVFIKCKINILGLYKMWLFYYIFFGKTTKDNWENYLKCYLFYKEK